MLNRPGWPASFGTVRRASRFASRTSADLKVGDPGRDSRTRDLAPFYSFAFLSGPVITEWKRVETFGGNHPGGW
jgi:hypothetical protein